MVWMEGGSEQIGCSVRDCEKRPRHTLVVINAEDDPFISCESPPVGMLGLCWAEELSNTNLDNDHNPQCPPFGRVW